MDEIIDGVYVGDFASSQDTAALQKAGVQNILSICTRALLAVNLSQMSDLTPLVSQ